MPPKRINPPEPAQAEDEFTICPVVRQTVTFCPDNQFHEHEALERKLINQKQNERRKAKNNSKMKNLGTKSTVLPFRSLSGKSASNVKEQKAIQHQRLKARASGLAGLFDERNFEEVLENGQAYMLSNVPYYVMQSLMVNFNDPVFKAQFEQLGVSITTSHAESTKKAQPKETEKQQNLRLGKYYMFYWDPPNGSVDEVSRYRSLDENKTNNPLRSFASGGIVQRDLRRALENIQGLVSKGLQQEFQWPSTPQIGPEFGVVRSGHTPVHQQIHCDNVASYRLSLATSKAIFTPLILSNRQADAQKFVLKTLKSFGWILHMPTSLEGMALRVAVYTDITQKEVEIKTIFIPFGCCLLLRADVFHSGHYGSSHNIRLHGIFPANNLDWQDDHLLFLEEGSSLEMPQLLHDPYPVKPEDMLQQKFNPTVQVCPKTGKLIGPRALEATKYLNDFAQTLHGEEIIKIYHQQRNKLKLRDYHSKIKQSPEGTQDMNGAGITRKSKKRGRPAKQHKLQDMHGAEITPKSKKERRLSKKNDLAMDMDRFMGTSKITK
jgi:hypothetical protein